MRASRRLTSATCASVARHGEAATDAPPDPANEVVGFAAHLDPAGRGGFTPESISRPFSSDDEVTATAISRAASVCCKPCSTPVWPDTHDSVG